MKTEEYFSDAARALVGRDDPSTYQAIERLITESEKAMDGSHGD